MKEFIEKLFEFIKKFSKKLAFVVIVCLIGAFLGVSVYDYCEENGIEIFDFVDDIDDFIENIKDNLQGDNDDNKNDNNNSEPVVTAEKLEEFRKDLYEGVSQETAPTPEKLKPVDYEELDRQIEEAEREVHVAPSTPTEEYEHYTEDEEIEYKEYVLDGDDDSNENTTGSRDFFIMNDNSDMMVLAPATLKGVGEHCNIWLVDAIPPYYTGRSEGNLTESVVNNIVSNVDAIYEKMTKALAQHKNVAISNTLYGTVGDVDNDGKINVLLYDIASDGGRDDAFIGGFFAATDMAGYSEYDVLPCDVIHMDIGINQGFDSTGNNPNQEFFGTIAHEFQHMLYYTYFGANSDIFETGKDLWYNESLSGLTDIYYADPSETEIGQQNLTESRVAFGNSNDYSGGRGYGDFTNFSDSLKNYGMSYMFSAFMQTINEDYGVKVYEYFIDNLTNSSNQLDSKKAQDIYKNMDMNEVVGSAIKNGFTPEHSAYNTVNSLENDEVLEYFYTAFMESYISDGGKIIENGVESNSITFWNNGSLWDYKNYSNLTEYSTLKDGDYFSLKGYSGNSRGMAMHEMTYSLNNGYTMQNPNIYITVGDSKDTYKSYLALYNNETRNSDIYPLTLGEEMVIDTKGKTPYLFINTFLKDVSSKVNYSWQSDDGFVEVEVFDDFDKFNDLDNHWAEEAIKYCVERGLFTGASEFEFSPDTAMSRGMFATILGKFADENIYGYSNNCKDVAEDKYYAPYINWAVANDIMACDDYGNFSPEKTLTREDISLALMNFSDYITLSYVDATDKTNFTDISNLSESSKRAIITLTQYEIINGDSNTIFNPYKEISRAEASAIIMNFDIILQSATIR